MLVELSNKFLDFAVDVQGARIVRFHDKNSNLEILQQVKNPLENFAFDECGGFPLLPIANRVKNNSYFLQGQKVELVKAQGHNEYLHGIGWTKQWQVTQKQQDLVCLSLHSEHECGQDYVFTANLCFALRDNTLKIKLDLEHQGASPRLYGLGFHPYFALHQGLKELLQINALAFCPERADQLSDIATTEIPAKFDYRQSKEISDDYVNHCYVDCHGVCIERELEANHKISKQLIMMESDLPYLMMYHVPQKNFIALEPQSHAVDGVNQCVSGMCLLNSRFNHMQRSIQIKVENIVA